MDTHEYVDWFRNAGPYINAHRGRTFVVQAGGDAFAGEGAASLVHDLALLHSLGVRLVVVHGIGPQLAEVLARRGGASGGVRITGPGDIDAVKAAAGRVRVEVEALLSMGIANSPMAGARIRVTGGNFVIARPLGVRDGVDYAHTGVVRRLDVPGIESHLDGGSIVLLSPLGFSPTGEVFDVPAEDVATAAAIELHAAKLVFLVDPPGFRADPGDPVRQLTLADAKALLARLHRSQGEAGDDAAASLSRAVHACRNGVARCHLLDRSVDGVLLLELFTRDGVGTMVTADPYETVRGATLDDVGGILELIEPLERDGTLVRRSRDKLETEIARFLVAERDGMAIACAAAYPFADSGHVELACLAVHERYRRVGLGDALLDAVESRARQCGSETLFVLTTQATHWFKERGFVDAPIDALPIERRLLYNYERGSKVLTKRL